MFEDTVLTQHILSITGCTPKTKQCIGEKNNEKIPSEMNAFSKNGRINSPVKSPFSVYTHTHNSISGSKGGQEFIFQLFHLSAILPIFFCKMENYIKVLIYIYFLVHKAQMMIKNSKKQRKIRTSEILINI